MDTLLKTSIFNQLEHYCINQGLIAPGLSLVIGLSGGPDSVFLLYFLKSIQEKYRLTLIAAHMDHGWRAESGRDAQFCKDLCLHLDIPYFQKMLADSNGATSASGSLEQDARRARRSFFQELVREQHAAAIALAHHQDDLVETFFIRLIRGSGLTGLTSIKPRNGMYIHPLLMLSKREILAFLHENSIAYCIDNTNLDTNFLRNNIRHNLVPVYYALDVRARENLVRTIEQLHQADSFIEKTAQGYYEKMVHDSWLALPAFLALDRVLQHRLLLLFIIKAGVSFTPTERFFAEIIRFFGQTESKMHWVAPDWGIEKIKQTARICFNVRATAKKP